MWLQWLRGKDAAAQRVLEREGTAASSRKGIAGSQILKMTSESMIR